MCIVFFALLALAGRACPLADCSLGVNNTGQGPFHPFQMCMGISVLKA